jgi:uncharacterized membrane protein YccC
MGTTLSRLGFDPVRMGFALRTALAACLGLLVAWLIGLEHPQWSAMTVWAASQPVRGMLIEKGLFRAAGTVFGVVAGVLLILVSEGQPAILVIGLSLWLGLCAGLGNVLRGFVAYGTILAGYSASMVALLESANPGHVFALGLDRLLTVLVGVAVASLIGLLFTPKEAKDQLAGEVRRLLGRVLRAMAAHLRAEGGKDEAEQRAILSEMAATDDALDRHGAGSLRSRRAARLIRNVVAAQVPALLWLNSSDAVPADRAISAALTRAAEAFESSAPRGEMVAALEQAEALSAGDPVLHGIIAHLNVVLRDRLLAGKEHPERPKAIQPVILHRDWVGARQASIRATGTMLLMGAVWLLTGWSAGPYVMLGTSVMVSVFSTVDNPALVMRSIFLGQLFGAVAALACRWLVWPFATSELDLVLMMMPFIILGAPPVAHRRTMQGGYDYNLIMLLLLQPAYPLAGTFGNSLATSAAVVAAPLIAMMVHELQDMAADPNAPAHGRIWRARLYHRLLRLVRWMEKTGERQISASNGSLAVMLLGSAILRIHELLREPGLEPGTRRGLGTALKRIRQIGQDPERAQRALDLVAQRLSREVPAEAGLIGDAANGLATNLAFFHRAGGKSRLDIPAGASVS